MTGAVDRIRPDEGQILELAGEGEGEGAPHRVDAAARKLDDDVRGSVDHIGVVAAKPAQLVDAAAAVQDVGTCIADDKVVDLVAGQVDRRNAGFVLDQKDLDVDSGGERIAGPGQHDVAGSEVCRPRRSCRRAWSTT